MKFQKLLGRLILMGAMAVPALQCFAQQVSLQSGSSFSREAVIIRVTTTSAFALGRESVTLVNNKLTVTMRSFEDGPNAGPAPLSSDVSATSADVVLGKLPQGSYSVDVLLLYRPTGTLSYVGTTQFTVGEDLAARSPGYPAYDFTDIWWNANESGWGISIHVKRNQLFAAWFVYDADGKPTWYTLTAGQWLSPNKYDAPIYATRAGPNSGLGPMSGLAVGQVGRGALTFNGYGEALFVFTVDGIQRSKNIVRQPF